ncbi:MAG TPA: hypothetical protein VH350_11630 [Candidatus Sulfotelmatobacter sp.]|nr:hypothetical protein [Candidatus Sulfotelmatobacter sp.]
MIAVILLAAPLLGQVKRLWVLQPPGEMVEYDPATFAIKQKVQLPPQARQSPERLRVNRLGQILFATPVPLPLAEEDIATAHKVWVWNGKSATMIDSGITRQVSTTGSNQAIAETSPVPFLGADGGHLFWFANRARRLQRENVDLSTTTTWYAWQTDLNGAGREDLVTEKFPDCRCETGTCEETCPYGTFWAPDPGVQKFFLMTQFIAGQTGPDYKASIRYLEQTGKWVANPLPQPLLRVLDAASGGETIIEAIPDTGCCGWSNQSNDQTLVLNHGRKSTLFDEQATYKNSDYDVSFYTSNARLSPDLAYVAMTIVSTAEPNKPIQLAEQGEANPEESQRIRKSLTELPLVEVKTLDDAPRRVAYVPHATLVEWLSEKELLIVEDHVLVMYTIGTGTRRKSSIHVEDAARVFLR